MCESALPVGPSWAARDDSTGMVASGLICTSVMGFLGDAHASICYIVCGMPACTRSPTCNLSQACTCTPQQ